MSNIGALLQRVELIDEAIKLKPDEIIVQLGNSQSFKEFIKGLNEYIKEVENDDEWYDNFDFINFLSEVQNEVNLKIRDKIMLKEDSVINSNTIGEALVANQDVLITPSQSVLIGIGIAMGILIGIAVGQIYTKTKNSTKKVDAIRYCLLLIIPSNQAMDLENGKILNKDDASKLINHAKRAYCFKEHDATGQKIAENVKCSDEPINYKTENSVFVHLVLSSSYKEIVKQRIRSNISDQISNNSEIKIKKISKLQSALSTKDFYDI